MRWTRKDNADHGAVEHEETEHADEPGRADAVMDGPGDEPVAEKAYSATLLVDSDDVPQVVAMVGGAVSVGAVAAAESIDDAGADDGWRTDRPVAADEVDLESERRQLIDLLIYAWDRARSPGVWERLTDGLAAVGVAVLRPDGEPFDAAMHEVGGVESTDDENRIDTVAETEVAGFADRGRVIREPVVVVFRRSMGSSSIPS